jgi:succinoglycan biosynthesis transport protein ExoP
MDGFEQLIRKRPSNLAGLAENPAMGAFIPQPTEHIFTWEQAVRVLRKNARFALLIALSLTAAVVAAALLMKDLYQPVARVEIDPVNSGIRSMQDIEQGRILDVQEYLETQAQILRSDGLGISVIRELHLDTNPEFVNKRVIAKLRVAEKSPAANKMSAGDAATFREQFSLANGTPLESLALESFRKRLNVNSIRNSRLIEVGFSSHDPKLAQLVTNTLVTQYIDQNYRHRYTTTMQASEWLSTQLYDLRQKVEEANQAVAEYQRKYGLVETDERDVPLAQLMSEVNHQLSDAQANRIEAEAYVRMIDLGQSESIPVVKDDIVYQNLMTQYGDTKAQLARTRTIYGDENSKVRELENTANELGAQVEAERSRMVNRVRTSFAAAKDREEMMLASREKLKAQMGDATSRMVTYRVLKNEAAAKAELYNMLQGRLKEAGIFAGLRSSNINVVDFASQLPKPTSPHRPLIIVSGVLMSCLLAVFMAFVKESLNNTLRTPDDVKEWTGLPSLGMLPRIGTIVDSTKRLLPPVDPARFRTFKTIGSGASQILLAGCRTAEGEAMRELRTNLLLSKVSAAPAVIIVSSSAAGEGKTTIATNLAISLAERDKTCLIESDLRRPLFAKVFGLTTKAGLSQVLTGETSLESALVEVHQIPNFSLLHCGTSAAENVSLIDSEHMKAMLITLRDRFKYIVVDTPPLIPFSDARVLATLADAVILVGRYGLTTRRALVRGTEILEKVEAPIIGVMLNDIDIASPDYHYYNYGFSRTIHGALDYYKNSDPTAVEAAQPTEPNKSMGAHA